jgi:ribosomal protein S18 acetylase RimI-like enzyme
MIQLLDYHALNPQQLDQLSDIAVLPDQLIYSGDIASGLYMLVNTQSKDIRALVWLVDDVPRGFMLLQRGAFLPPWAETDAATLHAVQVDHRFQRRGLWTSCMRVLPAMLEASWPEIRRLQLSVDPLNQGALACYRATGWVDSGTGFRTRNGYECQLSFVLPERAVNDAAP